MEHDVRVERFIIATLANSASAAAELRSGPCSTHPGKNTHKHIDQPPFLDRRFPRVQQHSSLWKYKDVFLMLLSVTNHGAGTSVKVSTQLYKRLLMDLFHPLPCVDCIDSSQNLGLPSASLSIASSRTSSISTATSNDSSLADLDLLVAEDDFA